MRKGGARAGGKVRVPGGTDGRGVGREGMVISGDGGGRGGDGRLDGQGGGMIGLAFRGQECQSDVIIRII